MAVVSLTGTYAQAIAEIRIIHKHSLAVAFFLHSIICHQREVLPLDQLHKADSSLSKETA